MDDESTTDAAREGVPQEMTSRGLYGICFQVAWVRAARDARYRRRSNPRSGPPNGATGGDIRGDGENVFERVLI